MSSAELLQEIVNCLDRAWADAEKEAADPITSVIAPHRVAETAFLRFRHELREIAERERYHEALEGQE